MLFLNRKDVACLYHDGVADPPKMLKRIANSGVERLYIFRRRITHTRKAISRHPYPGSDGEPSPAPWLGIAVGRGKARLSCHLLTAVKITCPTNEGVRQDKTCLREVRHVWTV